MVAVILFGSGRSVLTQEPDADSLRLLTQQFDKMLQLDQHLFNGTRYYNLYPNAPGHPFLEPDAFMPGKVVIRNREYAGLRLKFDICNQRVVADFLPRVQPYVLTDHTISSFELDGRTFRRYVLPKRGSRYCQEIGLENLRILYYWHKELVPLNNSLESYNQYTNQKRESYLVIDEELHTYSGKQSFIKCFPESIRQPIKAYLKTTHYLFRQASDAQLYNLLELCASLMKNHNHTNQTAQ